ncbi:DpnII family type II restriction endonuclease [Azospirillum halopraeferens]|uniref:DpnII family type II restriction endonuclease n=1 Tax=Azospirillum halopraeferens TaxID=34010 RepID=UPI001B3B5E0B|nr:DpnII family type II restriction endonuclease [Azospirillum halopraeferens]
MLAQTLDELLAALRPLAVDWRDPTALRVIDRIEAIPVKPVYGEADVRSLLATTGFDDAMLICRLFLGLSKDQFTAVLADALGEGRTGVKAWQADRDRFVAALVELGVPDAMAAEVNRPLRWSDVLVERLRSGRGSAIAGQKRGRGVEDFAEAIVRRVFGNRFDARCTFTGSRGHRAKCDFAVPSREAPRIVVEAKGYGATGSKMTDIIGDIEKIIAAKRPDTAFLFFTDGLTWRQRRGDLKKIVEYQNDGAITRIYTQALADRFEADLERLRGEFGLPAPDAAATDGQGAFDLD